jgi:hypothetical protein
VIWFVYIILLAIVQYCTFMLLATPMRMRRRVRDEPEKFARWVKRERVMIPVRLGVALSAMLGVVLIAIANK